MNSEVKRSRTSLHGTNRPLQELGASELSTMETPDRVVVQMTEWALPNHTNAHGTVFGGVVVSWIDIAGVAAAQRYARAPVVTLSIDHLHFLAPIRVGLMALVKAQVTFAGTTSIEVEALVDAEDTVTGTLIPAAKAYLTYVALDVNGKPKAVPPFTPRTAEEWKRYEEAEKRRAHRQQRRASNPL